MNAVSRVVFTGAESSGKTTLTQALARQFHLPAAEEYARTFLEKNGPEYDLETLRNMCRQHIAWQKKQVPAEAPLGIFDTDLINYKIWAEEVFGVCPDEILQGIGREAHHAYLVCAPDLPWEPDPLRESPDQLDYLFQRHLAEIKALGRPFRIVRGLGDERIRRAATAFNELTYQPPR